MSYDGLQDKDLPLKLRLMNFLWYQGWFVRPNVKISRYQEGKRTSDHFTDIDVLAIKHLPLQEPIVAISSAKSGKESDSAELFWLSGVKSYFGASLAYYIRSKANIEKTRSICEKLNIMALNYEQVEILEYRFMIKTDEYKYTKDAYAVIGNHFNELKTKKHSLYDYITERFWVVSSNNQLLKIITGLKDLNKIGLGTSTTLFMKYYLITLFSIPLYSITQQLVQVPANFFDAELQTKLMGGEQAREEKQKILESCKDFTFEVITAANFSISFADVEPFFRKIERLEYFSDLRDLVNLLVQNYRYSIYLPRMMDMLAFQLVNKSTEIPDVRLVSLPDLRKEEWETAAKLVKATLIFAERIEVLDKSEVKLKD